MGERRTSPKIRSLKRLKTLYSLPVRTISGKADNVKVPVNPNTCDFAVYAEKRFVENVEDDCLEMSLADAKMLNQSKVGDAGS